MLRINHTTIKLFLNLFLALNIVVLIIFFFPIKQAHVILKDHAWDGLSRCNGSSKEYDSKLAPGMRMAQEKGCTMCEVAPDLCQELGKENLKKALSYSGTNQRLQRVLAKLKRGERLTVGVVGGSVSKGFGIDREADYYPHTPTNLNRLVFDRLNTLFPAPNGVKVGDSGRTENMNSFINGAQGGVGTDYFSLCYGEHLPEDMDLVLIELAINDEVLLRNINSYELMVRSLLDLPNKPAVMNLQVFALKFNTVTNGGDMHQGVAQLYDLPTLSLRNALYPEVLRNSSLVDELFYVHPEGEVDTRHLSRKGHNLMGRIGAAYIDSQLCEMNQYEASIPNAASVPVDQLYPITPMPRIQLNMKYNKDLTLPPIKPQCFSMNGKKHPLVPFENKGWNKWNWKAKNYLVSSVPGSRVKFRLHPTIGNVEVHYLRSYQYKLGSVRCWVDEEVDRAIKLDGFWQEPYNIGRAATIRDDLTPGEHSLTCELLNETADPEGGKEFRLISVMSI
ncbi:hypothetical protein L204_105278 [Cryptococcus depauperatus]